MAKQGLLHKTWIHFQSHNGSSMGAAVSYYTVFSIGPLCVLLVAIAGFFVGAGTVQRTVIRYMSESFGASTGAFIGNIMQTAHAHPIGIVTAVLGGVSLFIAAVGALSEIDRDLDRLWALPGQRKPREKIQHPTLAYVVSYVWKKLVAFSVIPIFGLLFVGTTIITDVLVGTSGFLASQADIIDALMSFFLGSVLFAVIFHILPDTKLPKRELIFGGLITSVLFLVGKVLIGMYVNSLTSTASFGAAGSLVALLIWIYYSAQVFFLGASFTFIYSKERGFLSRKEE